MSSSGGRKARPRRLTVFEAQNPNFMQWVDKIVKKRDDEKDNQVEEKSSPVAASKPETNSITNPAPVIKRPIHPIGGRHAAFRPEYEKLHKCDKCNVSYDAHKELKVHKLTQGYKNNYYKLKSHKCNQCNVKFCTPEAMKTHHLETKKNDEYFRCEKCDYVGNNVHSFQTHVHTSEYKNNTSNTCSSCGYKSCTKAGARNHIAKTQKCRKSNAKVIFKVRKKYFKDDCNAGQNNDINDVEIIQENDEKDSSNPRRSLRRMAGKLIARKN